jgi:hypothetical protein
VQVVNDVFTEYLDALRAAVSRPEADEDIPQLIAQLERWHEVVGGVEALLPQVLLPYFSEFMPH